jgi:hypothetical protein
LTNHDILIYPLVSDVVNAEFIAPLGRSYPNPTPLPP